WGIHVDAKASYSKLKDLDGKKAAISRLGSGSHLMSIINAKNQNWDTTTLAFEIVNTLDGVVDALKHGKADYFMWERFMTKPLVDNGTFKHLANCPTPWPCFVIAVRTSFLEKNAPIVAQILEIINNTTIEFKIIPSIDKTLAHRYNQKIEDIKEWLSKTQWSQENLDEKTVNKIQNQLLDLKIIDKKMAYPQIVTSLE
ncbi:MAG TPA: ABC transporter substrate-binding protein, partial [Flavobacterium sp.]|nr:ABC transporter substrate-binding protein [Flavobacterium sp.]